jgi:hypothetical protein
MYEPHIEYPPAYYLQGARCEWRDRFVDPGGLVRYVDCGEYAECDAVYVDERSGRIQRAPHCLPHANLTVLIVRREGAS